MADRPYLDKQLDGETFRSFYYLKEELIDFCRRHGLPTSGGKLDITQRIAHFLDTGEVLLVSHKSKAVKQSGIITEDTEIESDFVCSEKHRAYFKQKIGNRFSFNVAFQKWLKCNTGKTYGEAIQAYHQILADKKKEKSTIDQQFEYNTYIRDFFADNEAKTLEQAIKCWNYKKSQQGHNRYEKTDLVILTSIS